MDIEKFSPKKAELITLAEKYKKLKIVDVDDEVGYATVKAAKKELGKKRKMIKDTGLKLRREAIDFQTLVLNREKELLEIIVPVEEGMKENISDIDEQREKNKRLAVLPTRIKELKEIGIEVEDDKLLSMSSPDYKEFFNEKNEEYLAEKARKVKEAEEKLKKEKKEAEEEAERIEKEKLQIEEDKKKIKEEKEEIKEEKAEIKEEKAELREERKEPPSNKDDEATSQEPPATAETSPKESSKIEDELNKFLISYMSAVQTKNPQKAKRVKSEFLTYIITLTNG